MIRAAALAAIALVPAVAQAQCLPASQIRAGALTGTWAVDLGAAQTMGAPMAGGSDQLAIQSSGGGLTLTIEGRRIALQRLPDTAAAWDWDAGDGVAVNASDAGITLGCDVNAMARFQGSADGVTWQVMAPSHDVLLVRWSMTNPAGAGLFLITR